MCLWSSSMNKQELIAAVAEDTGMSKVAAERAVNSVFENITAQLGVGATVALLGFGTFGASHRKAREGVNPRTGESLKIPARNVPKFSPGKALKEIVNSPKAKKAMKK